MVDLRAPHIAEPHQTQVLAAAVGKQALPLVEMAPMEVAVAHTAREQVARAFTAAEEEAPMLAFQFLADQVVAADQMAQPPAEVVAQAAPLAHAESCASGG